jgi:hypothetical protein
VVMTTPTTKDQCSGNGELCVHLNN